MSDFYEFYHECDKMSDGVSFCKINGSPSSQFSVDEYRQGVSLHSTTLYSFDYCPYCGERPGGDGE